MLLIAIEVYVPIAWHSLTANWVTIKQTGYRLPISEVRLDNLRNIVNANMSVEDALGLDNPNGALLSEAVTTREVHSHSP